MSLRQGLLLTSFLCVLLGAAPGPAASPEQVSVMVATRDLAVGEELKDGDLAEVRVDKEWVTGSVVESKARQYIVNQRLRHPVLKGDLFTWGVFETLKDTTPVERCARALALPETALEQVERSRQLLLERKR
ncbi:SAF domain-containing protein [Pyxidicoccus sp. 3LFB2]